MADLYGEGQPAPAAGSPEEISSFLNHLLQSNPSSSSSKFAHSAAAAAADSDRCYGYGFSEGECGGVDYSDPEGCFVKEKFENAGTSAGGSKRRGGVSSENELGDFSYDSEKGPEASEVPVDTARQRSSSKRSRTAEIHNLSEKRRRSRINEKMKALQNLIPNSNKTDKASMLDEAIEYLKQLQLQVQMLTMRNGLSLHPICLPGGIQPMQLPMTGFNFEEGNGLLINNRVSGAFPHNDDNSTQTAINLPNQYNVSNETILIPTVPNPMPAGSSFDLEPLFPIHYGALTISSTSKEICREGTLQAQLDADQSMKASSSRVS